MRKQRKAPKANIIILVIFMLITAAVIGLLVMWYVRTMLTFSNNFFAYNKAYYLAEWGLELQLTKIQQRWIWFQDEVSLSEYYPCIAGNKGRERWSALCDVSASTVAQGWLLSRSFDATTCNDNSVYRIDGGDAVWFPLFVEEWVGNVLQEELTYDDLFTNSFAVDIEVPNPDQSKDIGYGIVKLVQNGQGLRDLPEEWWFSWVSSSTYTNQSITKNNFPFDGDDVGPGLYYFVVFNPQAQWANGEIAFCVQSQKNLALTQIGAKSFATFRGVSVWLEARRTIELPGFVFSTVVER